MAVFFCFFKQQFLFDKEQVYISAIIASNTCTLLLSCYYLLATERKNILPACTCTHRLSESLISEEVTVSLHQFSSNIMLSVVKHFMLAIYSS